MTANQKKKGDIKHQRLHGHESDCVCAGLKTHNDRGKHTHTRPELRCRVLFDSTLLRRRCARMRAWRLLRKSDSTPLQKDRAQLSYKLKKLWILNTLKMGLQ